MEKTEVYNNWTLTMNGKYFYCACGCNVFKQNIVDKTKYICNSCKTQYSTVAKKDD